MRQLWVDTEYGFRDGRDHCESAFEPVLFCAIDGHTGQRWHFWQTDPRLRDFVCDHSDCEFVAHHAVVEMQYLLRQGIPVPEKWYCTMTGWKWFHNHATRKTPYSLVEAVTEIGRANILPPTKKALQKQLGALAFDWRDKLFLAEVLDYCFSDCQATGELVRYLDAKGRGPERCLMWNWATYLHVVAEMELKGLPYDRETYEQLQDQRGTVIAGLQAKVNETCPVYQEGVEKKDIFWQWVGEQGIEWRPKTAKGALSMSNEALKTMEHAHPFIGEFRVIKKSLVQLHQRTGTFDGATGLHHFDQNCFGTKTGRNSARRFLLAGPKWMRWLATSSCPRDDEMVLVSADIKAQEIGIAAALSGDRAMAKMAQASDPHWYFGMLAGRVGPDDNPRSRPERDQLKVVNLAMLYGRTQWGLADDLGISVEEASALVRDHKRVFPRYWDWSQDYLWQAARTGYAYTRHGWRCQWGGKENTFRNYPIQGGAADQMRLIAIYLRQQGVDLRAIIHDGFILLCPRAELPALYDCFKRALNEATIGLSTPLKMSFDFDIYGHRYEDGKGKYLWEYINQVMKGNTNS